MDLKVINKEVVVMRLLIDSHLIGTSIKNLRKSRNWTQEQLADLVGYSVRNLRRIENEGTVNLDTVNTFADIFEVSAIDILNGVSFFYKKRNQRFLINVSALLNSNIILLKNRTI